MCEERAGSGAGVQEPARGVPPGYHRGLVQRPRTGSVTTRCAVVVVAAGEWGHSAFGPGRLPV